MLRHSKAHLTLCTCMDCGLPGSSLSMEFSRQESWSVLPFLPPGDLPDPGIEPVSGISCISRHILSPLSHLGSPSSFFCGMAFVLERTSDRLWSFRVGYLTDVFLKMKSASPFKENHWQYLLSMIKLKCSNKNFRKLISTYMNLTTYQFLRLLYRGNLVTSAVCVIKCVYILNLCIVKRAHIFKCPVRNVARSRMSETTFQSTREGPLFNDLALCPEVPSFLSCPSKCTGV